MSVHRLSTGFDARRAAVGGAAEPAAGGPAAGVIAAARRMVDRGLVVGSVGNVSARSGGGLLITPSRVAYEGMEEADLVSVTLAGDVLEATHEPSRELPMHLAIYRARADVDAIVHTHSPHATAWSFLDRPLEPETEEVAYYGIGPVRTGHPAPAGSELLASAAVEALGTSRAALLGRHGVIATGSEPSDALVVAEAVEHQAQVALLLAGRELGGLAR